MSSAFVVKSRLQQPERRTPTSWKRYASAFIATVILSTAPGSRAHPQSNPSVVADKQPTIAVMYFDNIALVQHGDYEPLRKGISDMLITELRKANPAINLVERDQFQQLVGEQNMGAARVDRETAVRMGKVLGAHYMIFGGFYVDMKGTTLRLDVRAVNVETSRVEYVEALTNKPDALLDVITDLADHINREMKLPSIGTRRRASTDTGPRSGPGAWRALVAYSRALEEEDSKHPKLAADLYKQFLSSTPETYATELRQKAQKRLVKLDESP